MDIKSVKFMTDMKARINLMSYSNVMLHSFPFFCLHNCWAEPIQEFLDFRGFDFRDFRFTAVYNSILFFPL